MQKSIQKKPEHFKSLVVRKTPNNVVITLLDHSGKIINWTSRGCFKISETKKLNYNFLTQLCAPSIQILQQTHSVVDKLIIRGDVQKLPKFLVKTLLKKNIPICRVIVDTKLPHNGCRLAKVRRVR